MKGKTAVRVLSAWPALAALVAGCQQVQDALKTDRTRFLAPHKVVKAPQRPSVYPILPSLSEADPSIEVLPGATFPGPQDWTYSDEDYVIGPTDILDISVLDLFSDGLETVLRREVSASGYIDLPQLRSRIRAEGRTAEELKETVRQAYIDAEVLRDPTVSVTIAARRQNTFAILGAIARPGTYSIARADMRLLDALALAGDVSQTNIRYIYVIRPAPAIRKSQAEGPAAPRAATTRSAPPPIAPDGEPPIKLPPLPKLEDEGEEDRGPTTRPAPPAGRQPAEATPSPPAQADREPDRDAELLAALRELQAVMVGPDPRDPTTPLPGATPDRTPAPDPTPAPAPGGDANGRSGRPRRKRRYRFVYMDGRWVRVAVEPTSKPKPKPKPAKPAKRRPAEAAKGEQAPPSPPPRVLRRAGVPSPRRDGAAADDPYGWTQYDRSRLGRLIAINLTKLKNGDPRMNVVIRNNDIIHVPPLEVGEFYVMGEVARPGVYSLTGRRITVKQALAAAGNLGPLAWPKNSTLVRRLGPNQEQVLPLNVEAICRGEEPDVFLKPDDVLAIGTDVRAPFAAVVRNAFRLTYGFGFIYDRNFAEPLTESVDSKRFTRW